MAGWGGYRKVACRDSMGTITVGGAVVGVGWVRLRPVAVAAEAARARGMTGAGENAAAVGCQAAAAKADGQGR
jgi:hypothetical protein